MKSDDVIGRVKTYEAIIKGENVPEAGIPESFKVLVKELQALGLDVQILDENGDEVELTENIDYDNSEYRFEMANNFRDYGDTDSESLNRAGYTSKEFDHESGEMKDVEEQPAVEVAAADDFGGDEIDMED